MACFALVTGARRDSGLSELDRTPGTASGDWTGVRRDMPNPNWRAIFKSHASSYVGCASEVFTRGRGPALFASPVELFGPGENIEDKEE